MSLQYKSLRLCLDLLLQQGGVSVVLGLGSPVPLSSRAFVYRIEKGCILSTALLIDNLIKGTVVLSTK